MDTFKLFFSNYCYIKVDFCDQNTDFEISVVWDKNDFDMSIADCIVHKGYTEQM